MHVTILLMNQASKGEMGEQKATLLADRPHERQAPRIVAYRPVLVKISDGETAETSSGMFMHSPYSGDRFGCNELGFRGRGNGQGSD